MVSVSSFYCNIISFHCSISYCRQLRHHPPLSSQKVYLVGERRETLLSSRATRLLVGGRCVFFRCPKLLVFRRRTQRRTQFTERTQ